MVGLSDQEILNILRERKTNFEQVKQAKQSELRQKKIDLFRNPSSIQIQKDIARLEKVIANLDFYLNHANTQIAKFESKLNPNLQEETKPKQKTEAQTSYQPKEEPNKNIKQNSFNAIYDDTNSYLNNALAWIKDPSKKEDKFSLYLNPEDELKFKETNSNKNSLKEGEKKYTQVERDILQSMVDDIVDVTNYINIIDKTYSSKNNGIISVLENLKRKQKKLNAPFQKLVANSPLIALQKKIKENSKVTVLREIDLENTSEKPKTQSIKVRYENKPNNETKKVPVIDFEQAPKVVLKKNTDVYQDSIKIKKEKKQLKTEEKTNLQVTTNFNLFELEFYDVIPPEFVQNAIELLQNLQVLRDACGLPITITSGYRTSERNEKAGGAVSSQHLKAAAADFKITGMSPQEVANLIENLIRDGRMKQGGLGVYLKDGGWVHYDVRGTRSRWRG